MRALDEEARCAPCNLNCTAVYSPPPAALRHLSKTCQCQYGSALNVNRRNQKLLTSRTLQFPDKPRRRVHDPQKFVCRQGEAEVRRLEARLTRANAAAAAAAHVDANHAAAASQQAAATQRADSLRAELAALREANAARKAQIKSERSKVAEATGRIRERKAEVATGVRDEAQEQARAAAEARAKDAAMRADLIRQLRARERVPRPHVTAFDRSEAGGHGLLEEMSILVRLVCVHCTLDWHNAISCVATSRTSRCLFALK